MDTLPLHVRHALKMLLFGEQADEWQTVVAQFEATWGNFTEDALVRAINHGQGVHLVLAILALGDLSPLEAREKLVPFLAGSSPIARWASALELGEMHDARCFATLVSMLTEFLPPDPEYSTTWLYWCWRPLVPQILGAWGQPAAIAPLRGALESAIKVESTSNSSSSSYASHPASDPKYWARYQEEIVYALGRLGALGALTGINGDVNGDVKERLNWWCVHLAMGYLHGRYPITSILLWKDHPELRVAVEELLEHSFGLNQQERDKALGEYQAEKSFEIWSRFEQREQREQWEQWEQPED